MATTEGRIDIPVGCQYLIDAIAALDADSAAKVVCALLDTRPDIAPIVVNHAGGSSGMGGGYGGGMGRIQGDMGGGMGGGMGDMGGGYVGGMGGGWEGGMGGSYGGGMGGGGKGKGGKGGKGKGKKRPQELAGGLGDSGEIIGEYEGIIKSFNHMQGYGFIACSTLMAQGFNDVFLHQKQLNGFDVGNHVSFAATLNARGQPQAQSLKAATGGAKRPRV